MKPKISKTTQNSSSTSALQRFNLLDRKKMLMLIGVLVLILLPFIVTAYYKHLFILVGLAIILACSLDLVVGYIGRISFAHAAFYGIGAYTSAILTTRLGLEFIPSLLLSGLIAAAIGFTLGMIVLRLTGPYFAIVTIGFQEIVIIIFKQWVSLTRGPMGIVGVPKPKILFYQITSLEGYYFLLLGLMALIGILLYRTVTSRIGVIMLSVKDDETAARAIGINTTSVKVFAFTMSTFIAGIAGSFYAFYIGSVDPYTFQLSRSSTILVTVLAGGIGTMIGPVIGATVLTLLPELMRGYVGAGAIMIISGVILILVIFFMPKGIIGIYYNFLERKNVLNRKK